MTSGCLIAPDIEGKWQEPNYPPQIVLESLDPPDNGRTEIDETCFSGTGTLTFKVGLVRDRNVNDYLYVRWFLNWDASSRCPDPGCATFNLSPSGATERAGPEYPLDLNLLRPNINLGEVHTFRVLVADRPLDPDGNGAEFPEGSDGQLDIYQWTLEVASEGYCDQQ